MDRRRRSITQWQTDVLDCAARRCLFTHIPRAVLINSSATQPPAARPRKRSVATIDQTNTCSSVSVSLCMCVCVCVCVCILSIILRRLEQCISIYVRLFAVVPLTVGIEAPLFSALQLARSFPRCADQILVELIAVFNAACVKVRILRILISCLLRRQLEWCAYRTWWTRLTICAAISTPYQRGKDGRTDREICCNITLIARADARKKHPLSTDNISLCIRGTDYGVAQE